MESTQLLDPNPPADGERSPSVYSDDLTDGDEGHAKNVQRAGEIKVKFIRRPKPGIWFTKPHALNYFKDGILFRTKEERSATKLELFLDLMYVGLIANLAGEASENASWLSLFKYILFFIPIWVVWADIKDFVNYYYNEDLFQKGYTFWILCLLALFVNSHNQFLESTEGAALTVVPYLLCRLSLSLSYLFYSIYIPQHRVQMVLYGISIMFTCGLWVIVIFVNNTVKIYLSIVILLLEQIFFSICYHPWTKKFLKLRSSTALNIEHETERMSNFVTIAIGEFLYKSVADSPLGAGLTLKLVRGLSLILIAFNLFLLYDYGSTSIKSIHALRHSAHSAMIWIYAHLPLIAGLVLAADAGGDLIASDNTSTKRNLPHRRIDLFHAGTSILFKREEAEVDLYALSFFFTGGICFALICMFIISWSSKSADPKGIHVLSQFWRIFFRVPVGISILSLSYFEFDTTSLLGIIAALVSALLIYESIVKTPVTSLSLWCKLFPEQAEEASKLELRLKEEEQTSLEDDIENLKQRQADLVQQIDNENEAQME